MQKNQGFQLNHLFKPKFCGKKKTCNDFLDLANWMSGQLASNSPPKNLEKLLKNLVGGWTNPFETYYTPEKKSDVP